MRKILSALLSALIVSATVTSLPLSAGAASVSQDTQSVGAVQNDSVGATVSYGDLDFEYINSTEARLTNYRGNSASVSIPASINNHKVVEIGDYAFDSYGYASVGRPFMGNLEKVIIPEGVRRIGNYAFYFCMKLESAKIPSTVTEIGEYAFNACTHLNNVTIPKGVKTIEGEAFGDCHSLNNLTLHSNITKIEAGAFEDCSFESITIPSKVKKIGFGAFSDNSSLKTVTLNSELEEIDGDAFYYCNSLKSINIPDKVKSIGELAFCNCINLETVTGGKGLEKIGAGAFRDTKWDQKISEKKGTATYLGKCFCKYVPTDSQLKGYNLKIKDGTTCICQLPIAKGSALKSLILPASLKYIDILAFGYSDDWGYESCSNLSDVYYMGKESQWYSIDKGEYNDYLFRATIHYDYGHSVSMPKINKASNVYGGVALSWNAVDGAKKYKVFRKTADTNWTALATVTSTTYTDKDVVSGTTYYYTVRCVSPVDSSVYISGYSTTGIKKTYYAAPVLKTPSNVNGGVKVSWDAVGGASKYKVLRRNADSSTWKALGYTTSTSYTDKTAESGKTYYYSVRCVNPKDNSSLSGIVEPGLKKTYYAAPTLKKASNVNGGVTVTWEAVPGASKYKVIRKTADSAYKAIGYSTSTSYTDKTAVSGETYYYSVKCVNPNDNVNISDCKPGLKKTYIAAPVLSKIVNTSKGVQLSWKASGGAVNYKVYRKNSAGSWEGIGTTTDTTFYDREAESGKTYTYTVKCVNENATSAVSGFDNTGKTIKFIAAPVISSLTKTGNGITIKWNAPAGTSNHYKVFWKNENGNWQSIATTTTTSFTDYDVQSGTKYTYTIRVVSADENSHLSGYTSGKSITF